MVMCVDAWVDLCSPVMGTFIRIHDICIQNPRQFEFELDIPVRME
jgi:hypothetical protein